MGAALRFLILLALGAVIHSRQVSERCSLPPRTFRPTGFLLNIQTALPDAAYYLQVEVLHEENDYHIGRGLSDFASDSPAAAKVTDADHPNIFPIGIQTTQAPVFVISLT